MSDSKLPAGWSEKPLGALVSFQKGRKTDTSKNALNGYARYLGASGLSGKDDGFADMAGAVIAAPSDLLMLWDGERSGLVGYMQQGVVASTVSRLTPTDEIDSAYLYYKLVSLFDWIQARRTGTGVPHVPKDLGKILDIIYPKDTSVQRNIATILRTIDNQIDATQALIEKYTAIKQGMMADLFSRGIDPETKALRPTFEEAPELYHKTPLGMLPKGWVCAPIKKFVQSAEYGISTSLNDDSSGIPVLRMNNIQNNRFNVEDLKFTKDPEAYRLKLSAGDVLYNRTNSMEHVGKTAIWRGELSECSFASYLVRINVDERELLPEYFSFWMSQESSQNALRAFATPAVQQVNINPTNLQRVLMSCPVSLLEQQEIVDRIDAVDAVILREREALLKLNAQKSGLMQDLLTGKVPVPA
ncbi:restriction endonuclease subunit S [Vibrio cholerae]|uniref:restriction endonuclease subunit S n=1 Tax=Vibrio cholerae TaxID=666 RepID=UPI0011D8A59E|nr:restriction endonuclease subunit S [Vibrio cholerae]EGQ8188739.1 restriction endonuclease subunit S [Vibrio cholerae]EGR0356823.1 restriction endonuclease subunit S [Vibrio cholerae]TXX51367.1 restriction endonuclease subunit S [Vibrio cholerae]